MNTDGELGQIERLDLDDMRGKNLLPRYPADKDMRLKGMVGLTRVWDTFRFGTVRLFDHKDTDFVPIVRNQNIVSLYGLMATQDNKHYSYVLEHPPDDLKEGMTTQLLTLLMADIARGLYFICDNYIPYGKIDLDKIYTSGRRAKIEHPLLVGSKKLSFLDGLLNFAQVVEKSLTLWRVETLEIEREYLTYLYQTMRTIPDPDNLKGGETAEQAAQRALSRVISVLGDMTLGQNINIRGGSQHTQMGIIRSEDRTDVISFEGFKVRLESKPANQQSEAKPVKRPAEESDMPPGAVPNIRRRTLIDLRIPAVQSSSSAPPQSQAIQTFSDKMEACQVIQVAESKHGQGYFLEIEHGKFGRCLVKYFENRNEIAHQIQLYNDLGMPKSAIDEHKHNERQKHRTRELKFAHQLNHPNITKILAFISPRGTAGDINAIIMEGASLGTLETYAKKSQLPDLIIKRYALQLADALRYCHDKLNIIHRDVRPRNVYVHDDGTKIKLGNFGYAREEDSEMKGANKGDELYYKAPEMIYMGNVTCYSYPVDVYSNALVLWSISHRGSRPFWDQNRMLCANSFTFRTYLEKSNENRPPIRENLDPLLAKIIRRCWLASPTDRPTMAEIFSTISVS